MTFLLIYCCKVTLKILKLGTDYQVCIHKVSFIFSFSVLHIVLFARQMIFLTDRNVVPQIPRDKKNDEIILLVSVCTFSMQVTKIIKGYQKSLSEPCNKQNKLININIFNVSVYHWNLNAKIHLFSKYTISRR